MTADRTDMNHRTTVEVDVTDLTIRLEAVKALDMRKALAETGRQVRIWSSEWEAWWRPRGAGYTTEIEEAGIYDFADALDRTWHCDAEKGINYVIVDSE